MTALWRAATGGEKFRVPAGAVGDGSEQFRAQHNCAVLTSGASFCICALAQQSIMPVIGHSRSSECMGSGVPASTLASIATSRKKAVSHFFIANQRLYTSSNDACQGKRYLPQFGESFLIPMVERDSHNSSMPPSLDPPWKKVQRTKSLRQKTAMKAGGQPVHRGATLRQVAQPDMVITHAPEVCRGCGRLLRRAQATGYVRRQVFDIRDGRTSVTEHRSLLICCRKGGAPTKAHFPAGVRAPVQYGSGVLARVCYLHLYQLLPVNRTSEAMRDLFGCPLSWATVERASRLFSGKLVRCEQRIKAAIRNSAVIGADETGLRVAGANGWIHVARTERLTHLAYDSRRGKAAEEADLSADAEKDRRPAEAQARRGPALHDGPHCAFRQQRLRARPADGQVATEDLRLL